MKESGFLLAFTTMATPGWGHKKEIELALDLGFKGVDLRCSEKQGEVTLATSLEELARIKKDFISAGVSIPCLFSYHKLPAGAYIEWGENISRHILIAQAIGAKAVRIFSLPGKEGEASLKEANSMAKVLINILEKDKTGIGVTLQNHKKQIDIRAALEVAETVNNPRFGLAFSPDHIVRCNAGDPLEFVQRALPWTKEVFISDYVMEGEKGRSVLPGKGVVPLEKVIRAFIDLNFKGYFTFKWEKIWEPELPEAKEACKQFIRFFNSITKGIK